MSRLADVDRPLVEERDHLLRPWVLAGAVAIAVVAVAAAFYYAPLEAGSLSCPPPAELVPAPESEAGAAGRERCVLTSASGTTQVAVSLVLANTGRLPITVQGVDLDAPMAELVTVGAISPFALGGGEERELDLDLEVHACDPARGERLLTLTELPVRVRFLGLPKTTGAALDTELSVLRSAC